jgi:hypothetical protein
VTCKISPLIEQIGKFHVAVVCQAAYWQYSCYSLRRLEQRHSWDPDSHCQGFGVHSRWRRRRS